MTNNFCTNLEHKIFVLKEHIRRSADNSMCHCCINLLAPELFFLNLAHPVYKM